MIFTYFARAILSLVLFFSGAHHTHAMTFRQLVDGPIVSVGNAFVNLLYALAFIMLLIGIFRYFFVEGQEGREKGKQLIVWGIFGLFILFSVWGIVQLLLNTLPRV